MQQHKSINNQQKVGLSVSTSSTIDDNG